MAYYTSRQDYKTHWVDDNKINRKQFDCIKEGDIIYPDSAYSMGGSCEPFGVEVKRVNNDFIIAEVNPGTEIYFSRLDGRQPHRNGDNYFFIAFWEPIDDRMIVKDDINFVI